MNPHLGKRSGRLGFAGKFVLVMLALMTPAMVNAAPRPSPKPKPKPEATPGMQLVVAAGVIQQAIAKYQTTTTEPKLDSAELTFKVTSGGSIGMAINFWIITIGASVTQSEVQTVAFSYKVPASVKPPTSPAPGTSSPTATPKGSPAGNLNPEFVQAESLDFLNKLDINSLAETNPNMLAESLAASTGRRAPKVDKFQEKLLGAIKDAAKAAKEVPKIGGADFQSFTVTIDYSVKFEGSGSATVPVLTILSIGPKGSINRESAHSIKLVFGAPSKQ